MNSAHRIEDTAGAPSTGAPIVPTPPKLTPRQRRALKGLIEGPKTREQIDRIAGASNGPAVVATLRRRGILIDCATHPMTDRDGLTVYTGLYTLKPASLPAALALLKAAEGHQGGDA